VTSLHPKYTAYLSNEISSQTANYNVLITTDNYFPF